MKWMVVGFLALVSFGVRRLPLRRYRRSGFIRPIGKFRIDREA